MSIHIEKLKRIWNRFFLLFISKELRVTFINLNNMLFDENIYILKYQEKKSIIKKNRKKERKKLLLKMLEEEE